MHPRLPETEASHVCLLLVIKIKSYNCVNVSWPIPAYLSTDTDYRLIIGASLVDMFVGRFLGEFAIWWVSDFYTWWVWLHGNILTVLLEVCWLKFGQLSRVICLLPWKGTWAYPGKSHSVVCCVANPCNWICCCEMSSLSSILNRSISLLTTGYSRYIPCKKLSNCCSIFNHFQCLSWCPTNTSEDQNVAITVIFNCFAGVESHSPPIVLLNNRALRHFSYNRLKTFIFNV